MINGRCSLTFIFHDEDDDHNWGIGADATLLLKKKRRDYHEIFYIKESLN